MKVLFLDISGVLTRDRPTRAPVPPDEVDRAAVARVNAIVAATGAHIVLSTDWVKNEPALAVPEVQGMLRAHGLVAEFAGATDQPGHHSVVDRGIEIRAWLKGHPEVTGVAILDDFPIPITAENRAYFFEQGFCRPLPEPDAVLGARFVEVEGGWGLSDGHVARAIAALAMPWPESP